MIKTTFPEMRTGNSKNNNNEIDFQYTTNQIVVEITFRKKIKTIQFFTQI